MLFRKVCFDWQIKKLKFAHFVASFVLNVKTCGVCNILQVIESFEADTKKKRKSEAHEEGVNNNATARLLLVIK